MTVVNHDTGEIIETLDKAAARRMTTPTRVLLPFAAGLLVGLKLRDALGKTRDGLGEHSVDRGNVGESLRIKLDLLAERLEGLAALNAAETEEFGEAIENFEGAAESVLKNSDALLKRLRSVAAIEGVPECVDGDGDGTRVLGRVGHGQDATAGGAA